MNKHTILPDEMLSAAQALDAAAAKYRALYAKLNGDTPVVWIQHVDGHMVLIADSYYAPQILKVLRTNERG